MLDLVSNLEIGVFIIWGKLPSTRVEVLAHSCHHAASLPYLRIIPTCTAKLSELSQLCWYSRASPSSERGGLFAKRWTPELFADEHIRPGPLSPREMEATTSRMPELAAQTDRTRHINGRPANEQWERQELEA